MFRIISKMISFEISDMPTIHITQELFLMLPFAALLIYASLKNSCSVNEKRFSRAGSSKTKKFRGNGCIKYFIWQMVIKVRLTDNGTWESITFVI